MSAAQKKEEKLKNELAELDCRKAALQGVHTINIPKVIFKVNVF